MNWPRLDYTRVYYALGQYINPRFDPGYNPARGIGLLWLVTPVRRIGACHQKKALKFLLKSCLVDLQLPLGLQQKYARCLRNATQQIPLTTLPLGFCCFTCIIFIMFSF